VVALIIDNGSNIKLDVIPSDDKDKVVSSIVAILEHNRLLSLATVNKDCPNVCTSFYVFDDSFNLYIWTDPKAQHSINVAKNPNVAVNIVDTYQEWGGSLRGLQIFGSCGAISGKEALIAGGLYLKRYTKASTFVKTLKDFNSKKLQSMLYKIQMDRIKVLDEVSFGKDQYRELIITRE